LIGFLDRGVEAAPLPENFLCALVIVPEVGLRALLFYFGKFGAFIVRVKETSATRRLERPGLRVFVLVLQSFLLPRCESRS
jgi:hypothetical protein